jgi:hypothetical protein
MVVEGALEGELDDHLGYAKNDPAGRDGGQGHPRPLLLTRHAGRGPLAEHAAQVLALSKMDCNTDALYGGLPATVSYAQMLANVVRHEKLPPIPYDYRLFM